MYRMLSFRKMHFVVWEKLNDCSKEHPIFSFRMAVETTGTSKSSVNFLHYYAVSADPGGSAV